MHMMDKREHKVKCHFGANDYYQFYKKNHNEVDRSVFGKVVTEFNQAIGQLIIGEGLEYILPKLGFELILRKDKRKPRIKDGKLLNNIPVDWKKTNSLWERDEYARDKKLLVRYNNSHTSGFIYRVYFKKFNARVQFRSVYKFQVNRDLKRDITNKLNNSEQLDAYLLYKTKD
jgi:hypothetical protein